MGCVWESKYTLLPSNTKSDWTNAVPEIPDDAAQHHRLATSALLLNHVDFGIPLAVLGRHKRSVNRSHHIGRLSTDW